MYTYDGIMYFELFNHESVCMEDEYIRHNSLNMSTGPRALHCRCQFSHNLSLPYLTRARGAIA